MNNGTITLGGEECGISPLKSLQVAELLDEIEAGKAANENQAAVVKRSLKTIAHALANGKHRLVEGLNEADAIDKINDVAAWKEVNAAFLTVLDVCGLRKTTEGEAQAAESTSNESSAASSAS